MQLSEQEIVRRNAREELEKLGIDPYPAELYEITHLTSEIRDGYSDDKSNTVCCSIIPPLFAITVARELWYSFSTIEPCG